MLHTSERGGKWRKGRRAKRDRERKQGRRKKKVIENGLGEKATVESNVPRSSDGVTDRYSNSDSGTGDRDQGNGKEKDTVVVVCGERVVSFGRRERERARLEPQSTVSYRTVPSSMEHGWEKASMKGMGGASLLMSVAPHSSS